MKNILITIFLITSAFSQTGKQKTKINLLTYGGLPKSTKKLTILYNEAYIIGYNESLNSPIYACYRLGNRKGEEKVQKWERPYRFTTDERVENPIEHDDYTSSGYDRGHLAPNSAIANNYGQMAQLETFLTSNIVPQKPNLNRGLWLKVEDYVKNVISQDDTKNKQVVNTYVIAGVYFKNDYKKLKNKVPIPAGFFKIVTWQKGYGATKKAIGFLFPQDTPRTGKIEDYLASIDKIENITGLDFFSTLSKTKQNNLEKKKRNINQEEIKK